jgi:LytS/YehU family sensor histidine kinase
LQSNDKLLTTLKAEMDFIHAYFFLLRTRFSENMKYEIDVPEKFLSWQIPPLTLQLLVENAVKHNIVSSGKPLTIKIYMDTDNLLVVTNNRQVKTQSVLSNKIGLNNISVKYKLLSQPDIMVEQTDTKFEVKLTLIPEDVIMGTTNESIIYSN